MYVWNDVREYGNNLETGEQVDLRDIPLNDIFSEPVVWGFAGLWRSSTMVEGSPYDKLDCKFVQHITCIIRFQSKEEPVNCSHIYQYVRNGVVQGMDYRYKTLLHACKNMDLSRGLVHFPHNNGGYVRVEFDDDIKRFMTKVKMLMR